MCNGKNYDVLNIFVVGLTLASKSRRLISFAAEGPREGNEASAFEG